MRRWLLALILIISLYLDTTFFSIVNLYGIRPDVTLAIVVSLGVLIGPAPAAAIGVGLGLMADIFFNKIVGLTALSYMIAGIVSGVFFKKFYADNIIIPTVIAAVAGFAKEHLFFIAAALMGARLNYPLVFAAYILPCALVTGGACALIHLLLKRALYKPLWRQEAITLKKGAL